MFGSGRNFRRQKAGKPISVRTIDGTKVTVEGQSRFAVAAPLAMGMVGSIPCLRLIDDFIVMFKTNGTVGIPARSGTTPGSGAATRINFDGTALVAGAQITLQNINGSAAIGPSKYGVAVKLGPYYFPVMAEC
jgi:hypothetical protein